MMLPICGAIELGQQFHELQVVSSGIEARDKVITEGQLAVAQGAKVKVI